LKIEEILDSAIEIAANDQVMESAGGRKRKLVKEEQKKDENVPAKKGCFFKAHFWSSCVPNSCHEEQSSRESNVQIENEPVDYSSKRQTEELASLLLPPVSDTDHLNSMVILGGHLRRNLDELMLEAKSELLKLGLDILHQKDSPLCKLLFRGKGVGFAIILFFVTSRSNNFFVSNRW